MWFQLAAEAGHVGAARALGQLCVSGGGFGRRSGDGGTLAARGGDRGRLMAAYELGICLAHGIGTPRDDTEALTIPKRCSGSGVRSMHAGSALLVRPHAARGSGDAVDLPAVRAGFLRAAAEGVGDALPPPRC